GGKSRFLQAAKTSLQAAKASLTLQAAKPSWTLQAALQAAKTSVFRGRRHRAQRPRRHRAAAASGGLCSCGRANGVFLQSRRTPRKQKTRVQLTSTPVQRLSDRLALS